MIEFDLVGADVLWPEGLMRAPLGLCAGRIAAAGGGREVDLSGYLVLPGIVDMHGDGFERHLAPRRGVMKDLAPGLASVDAELAANGITTAVLAQFWSWEGGMRSADFARRFLTALDKTRMLTDCRVQLRFETHLLDDYAAFEETVAAYDVGYVVFNDHLPHAALENGKRPPRLTGQALKSGRSPEAHLTLLQALHARRSEVEAALDGLASRLNARGVLLGSHDDATDEIRAKWRARGVSISEFPETQNAAASAHDGNDAIVLGAPNVVRGGSHSGNAAASDLVGAGLCDALASDYHYPALRQSVLRLINEGIVTLEAGWALVSSRPAEVMGLSDRGSFTLGKRADLIVMEPETGRIGATLVAGKISYLSGDVASRFLS
ncbi:alpha-D-ribose 1-methylphosphonate 5-triphosphate diphosphatase [Shimia abyssi]|uniref:Alpha-D-ribose 1-methylphosphonate 5-triphosphate diphosphatase n=1 Tax=Shimia abyssi TaxID=1662395 RepID=A0A2P8FES3_9RHOB|nr:alpha-D-ribose 1-methylphosphonate 5-triphosphate diphosphatase [Shimia abyssi]